MSKLNKVIDYRDFAELPLGLRNNNPGNIRPGDPWVGKIGENAGFVVFKDVLLGIRALCMDLCNKHLKGYDSIREQITRYAPPEDKNKTEAYIQSVAQYTGLDPEKPYALSRQNLINMVMAICIHENGHIVKQCISPTLIKDCLSTMPLKLYKLLS